MTAVGPIRYVRPAAEAGLGVDISLGANAAAAGDRAQTSKGYKFKTFDEMSGETAAKNWLIKGIFAKSRSRKFGFRNNELTWSSV